MILWTFLCMNSHVSSIAGPILLGSHRVTLNVSPLARGITASTVDLAYAFELQFEAFMRSMQDEVLIAGFGRRGHAVGDIPGVRFKVGLPVNQQTGL